MFDLDAMAEAETRLRELVPAGRPVREVPREARDVEVRRCPFHAGQPA